MKILLVHPEDDPENGPWANRAWDQVVDIGLGGVDAYARWSRRFGCPITTLSSLRGVDDFQRVRRLLAKGCGQLIDEHGLDWWEILSLLLHGELESYILLQHFARSVSPADEVCVSRPGLHASLLRCLRNGVKVFPLQRAGQRNGLRHYLRVAHKLSVSQMIDVIGDKYDGGYQFRGRFARRGKRLQRPAVLLPTAYVNVSRTGAAYAMTFPEENFLLVATRRSGWMQDLPQNVTAARLSAYASLRDRRDENDRMEGRWRLLLQELTSTAEFESLNRLGYLDNFPRWLRHGFEVRDAWRNVLDREPIEGVLCADDSNPNTRIPLLLAQARELPNVACHHGALDGRYLFKRSHADVILVKGKMEKDYLVRRCDVPQERVEMGAPARPANWNSSDSVGRPQPQPFILFFSEPYETWSGRQEEFYRDILPSLAEIALATGRNLVVKLHAAESERERAGMIEQILSGEQKQITQIVSGPLTEDLLAKTWFGITVLSTAAMECSVRGIPCFLCRWLEFLPYGYVEQYIRFGIGIGLQHAGEIKQIPQVLLQYQVGHDVAANCWQPAAAGRLREILTSSHRVCTTAAS
jgi:hypothetical protein